MVVAMDSLERHHRPRLRSPAALLAWRGWNDAAEGASEAIRYLLSQNDDLIPMATIHPEEFFDFQVSRPVVGRTIGGARFVAWPETKIHVLKGPRRDLLVLDGNEPNVRWKTYCETLIGLLRESKVGLVVTLGAFVAEVPHTRPVPLVGVSPDRLILEEHGLPESQYVGPTGIPGVMQQACLLADLKAVSIWAGAPHYLAANHNPMVTLALLRKADEILGFGFDLTELERSASEYLARVDEAMADNDEFVAYLRSLEAETEPPPDLEGGAGLIGEIEDFLKGR